ncbi:ATP-dependent Clp protease ATP-binding subunit [Coprothermobacter platensis]|uniref:ATP-dependent Clp protease ATP-binding subunit n=1 Tax=Coprothermobacter platensis TaxID=108819 RepID=UPI00035F993D|nr:AAA family ATPase [Coprothermobacter platensis]
MFDDLFQQFFGDDFSDLFPEFFERRKRDLTDYLSSSAMNALQGAANLAGEAGHNELMPEHLAYALLEDETLRSVLQNHGVNVDKILHELETTFSPKGTPVSEVSIAPELKSVLERAVNMSRNSFSESVTPEELLLAIIEDGGTASQIMQRNNLKSSNLIDIINEEIRNKPIGRVGQKTTEGKSNTKLQEYGRDLTDLARQGKLDPIVGRDNEIQRVLEILSRRTKNNPVLIGDPGVGKTAIVEGIAERIASDDVPDALKGKHVVELDIGSLVAGTKYRGEFEERMQEILDEIMSKKDELILFIDELHTIVGAGGAEGAVDASNMLKPALARGDLHVIGATTIDDYRKYIEKDPALERRFQPVYVPEPTLEDTIAILKVLKDKLEAHHKVKISDSAIKAAVYLSDRYIADRHLPDKAIDLLDEACAKVRLSRSSVPKNIKDIDEEINKLQKELRSAVDKNEFERAAELRDRIAELKAHKEKAETSAFGNQSAELTVTDKEIAQVVSAWTGIPVTELEESEKEKLARLEEILHERVVGQDEAISAVSQAIRRARTGLKDPKRPIGSFIFLGPTGVGKTELAKTLAEVLFGDESALVRFDMSEYMEKHTVSRLIGSPPGYVGYEEGGQLTEAVRRRPYSVILFDEIEKAHPDIHNLLLQVLDDGRLTDAKGHVVDFKNTIIIMTSNLGSQILMDAADGKIAEEEAQKRVMDLLKTHFRPEFLNRVDDIVFFKPLTKDELKDITRLQLNNLAERLQEQHVKLVLTDKAIEHIAELGYDPELGARPLKRVIQKEIENRIAEKMVRGEIKPGNSVEIDFDGTQFELKSA